MVRVRVMGLWAYGLVVIRIGLWGWDLGLWWYMGLRFTV